MRTKRIWYVSASAPHDPGNGVTYSYSAAKPDATDRFTHQIFVSPQSIRVTDYDNEEIDNIRYTDITKIDHKHDKGMNDGHKNFLAFNLKV